MNAPALPPPDVTPCSVPVPHLAADPTAHVVMFASGGEFAGATYQPGARVYLCLRHADDVLTAKRTLPDSRAFGTGRYAWLTPGLDHLPSAAFPARAAGPGRTRRAAR